MAAKTKAEEIYSIVSSIIGLKAWEVTKGFAYSAFLEFGELKIDSFGRVGSDRFLSIYGLWRIETSEEVLTSVQTYVEDTRLMEVLQSIEGKELLEVTIAEPSLDTTFHFEDDLNIFVYNAHFQGNHNEAWNYIYPVDNVLSIGPGSNYSIESYSGR
ncbi:MAG: hypothetical protein DWQ07_22270 [Chloroflexi bacterium]|nr:MAG: hypothetical protein DWQ07_22270 [Chloroflexota bacterium]MBL1193874.1 hypothetical protein [Chloroflexota bacterium]NOH11168.1 hypothetical protein [Chloroflexota bacterium]